MRIAITDSYPNQAFCSEREFVQRFKSVAQVAGHTVAEVTTSDDIHACKPDFVLCLSEFTPKLTPYPTFGVMWSPPQFYKDDPYRVRVIRSYDAYLLGSEPVRLYLKDLEFSSGVAKPKSEFHFLPVAQERPFVDRERRSLMYVGVHWDGPRHGSIIDRLTKWDLISVYGPRSSWSRLKSGYAGELPFDGRAVHDALSAHGIALCLHKDDHRTGDTPSSRLFEAAAAGCVIISDEIPFARRVLGDAAFYVNLREPSHIVAKAIADHVAWIIANPERASSLAQSAHERLNRQYSLESQIQKTCDFAETVAQFTREKRALVRGHSFGGGYDTADGPTQVIDVIVRCGDRPLKYVQRAIESLERQSVGPLRALLVDYKGRADIESFAKDAQYHNVHLTYLRSPNNGLRSTTLWTGLAHIDAPFFSVLDDDDALMEDHFCGLLYSSIKNPESSLVYCGAIRREEDNGHYHRAPNFRARDGGNERVIPETCDLKFLDEFRLERLIALEPFMPSNAWIARSTLLNNHLLLDPELECAEDIYLYVFLASRAKFICSNQPTAYRNYRSTTRDSGLLKINAETWRQCKERISSRLRHLRFEYGATLEELEVHYSALAAVEEKNSFQLRKQRMGPWRRLLHSIPVYETYSQRQKQRRRDHAQNGHTTY